jgi:hypothetical protein
VSLTAAMELNFPITGSGPCSTRARALGFTTFAQIANHVRALPYGRVENDPQGVAVLERGGGTCSSKHKFLAILARECGQTDVRLSVGLYEMCERNTPGVGPVLDSVRMQYIPEAHCYLAWRGQRYDFTGVPTGHASPFESLLEERQMAPEDLPEAKLRFHRQAVFSWAEKRGLDFERVWEIREQCIAALSQGVAALRETGTT